MGTAYTVALVGFAEIEAATFESFFRLAARRPPAYRVQDEVMDAQILLVNADNLQALHLVQYADLPGKVLLIGSSDGGTGWPLQRKPVKLVSVLAELDRIVGVAPAAASAGARRPVPASRGADRGFAATEPIDHAKLPPSRPMVPAAAPGRRSADSDFPPTRPMVRSALSGAAAERAPAVPAAAAAPARSADTPSRWLSDRAARPGVMRLTDFGGLDELPSPPSRPPRSRSPKSLSAGSQGGVPPVQRGDMLLVAESLVEGRILHKRFKKYGLSIDWSREGKQALVMMKAHAYRLVVVDRLDGEPDAYQVCRTAKQTRQPNGQPPVVIMFAPSAGSMDRIKAGLAGSDAYLSRSVAESEFYKVLAQHRLVSLDGFAKTNVGF